MAMCEEYKVPIVITSLGARAEVNDAVYGWVVWCCHRRQLRPQGGRQGR